MQRRFFRDIDPIEYAGQIDIQDLDFDRDKLYTQLTELRKITSNAEEKLALLDEISSFAKPRTTSHHYINHTLLKNGNFHMQSEDLQDLENSIRTKNQPQQPPTVVKNTWVFVHENTNTTNNEVLDSNLQHQQIRVVDETEATHHEHGTNRNHMKERVNYMRNKTNFEENLKEFKFKNKK